MRPVNNQSGRLYGTAKIWILQYKWHSDIHITQSKLFRIDHILYIKSYTITVWWGKYLIWYWNVIYDLPVLETVDYIVEHIYVHKKIKLICSEAFFKRLLLKLSNESKFTVTNSLKWQ